jgi:hypothetical protein
MKYLTFALLLVSSVAYAATPNLAIEWTGNPQDFGGDSFVLRCGSNVYADAVSPTQVTDAAGDFVICGEGEILTLHVANPFGESDANGNLVMARPTSAPAISVIVLP